MDEDTFYRKNELLPNFLPPPPPKKTPVSVQKVKRIIKKTFNLAGYRLMDIRIIQDKVSSLCCLCCFDKDCYLELSMNNAEGALRNETSQNIGIVVTVDGTWVTVC